VIGGGLGAVWEWACDEHVGSDLSFAVFAIGDARFESPRGHVSIAGLSKTRWVWLNWT
jgi:hypothetical protein